MDEAREARLRRITSHSGERNARNFSLLGVWAAGRDSHSNWNVESRVVKDEM
jgi:hypothetical protein